MGGRRKILLASGLLLLVVLLTVPTTAECPNGCSGNGACMAKDMCNCYKNYQGNDCMERTCQFGYAHVDTPKGDIDMDQDRKTASWILTNSQQAPSGTYEYFNPNAATSEAHFYMECSNKGLCDRSLGSCTCFDGYEGVACQRAACPNKCSGHGTCESLRELGLKAPGTLFGIPYNVQSISYDLWDSRATYGCRCDPWYHGPDCSLRSCKVGVDPMFLSVGSATYEAFALHVYLAASITTWTANSGTGPPENFVRLRLFDYHGESYITEPIPMISDSSQANSQTNADAVAAAITRIPNLTFRKVLCEPTGAYVGADLDGYKSTRLASTLGLSVVCQFYDNPGDLRAPEVADYGFNGVVDPAKKFAKIYTVEEGFDNEWFTTQSTITVTTVGATPFTALTVANPAPAVAVETNPTLFKLGSHVVVGKLSAATTITLIYGIVHTLPSAVPRFDVPSGSGMVVTELVVAAAVALGANVISVTTDPAFAAGDLIFFENQFFKYASVVVNGANWDITLNRAFSGNSATGAANTVLKVYKVTPPTKSNQYNYVSPCSGRGICGTETGVCACFKGYTNDNCDTQNILAL
ncbi:hypothetical protein PR003_g7174 [Phytophthora rubi]|uniref:EGF-like domain-containing protein n=1 Tax=Phytophthora rubi TaxID=129364 RepID=A0A6A3N3X2_9STRA|nr:hypothetical protein PR002_g6199 [Phytophthora rubi]KAE9043278.1 hypothetical protein PR001_g5859 [Phytophthora rubi]KAE9346960.1 hypothetical protein PR003_g7174 [Phytophthora rubi]